MTKEEVIENAYKHQYQELIRMEDGTVALFDYEDENEEVPPLYKKFGFERNEIDIISGDMEPDRWRPECLAGIEDNNGWIKVVSKDSLPKQDVYCEIIRNGQHCTGKFLIERKVFRIGANNYNKGISHYRLFKSSLPIY